MKVTFVRHVLRLRRSIVSATGGNKPCQQRLYVRLELEDGTFGYGEAAPHATRGPTLVLLESEARQWATDHADDWVDQWTKAPLVLQMAIVDALARRQRVPAWRFFGVPEPPRRSNTLLTFGGSPDQIREQIVYEKPAAVKLKLLGDETDPELLAAVCEVFRGPLAMDVNAAWPTWDIAADKLEQLSRIVAPDCHVLWVEQPCPVEKMHQRLPTDFPIFADEGVMHTMFRWELYDGIVIKPAASAPQTAPRIRALAACVDLARAATENGVLVTMGCHLQSSLLTSASLQLAGMATAQWLDLDTAFLVDDDPFTPNCIDEQTGQLTVDDANGFGKTPIDLF